jgi:hypothetical protein
VKFATSFSKKVFIERNGCDIIISPDNPKLFVAELNVCANVFLRILHEPFFLEIPWKTADE